MSEDATPDIAIVGLAARFPGAADAARFWENLRDGVESIAALTDEELLAAGVDPAHLADPRYVRAKGVLAGADRFDAGFFGFTPREAEAMDPQHRVFLECAWEALEDAGCDPSRFAGRIGVWAGAGVSSYLIANLLPASERLEGLGGLQVLVLNDRDFLATRASFALDLRGPSAVVQTACSTSLYAAHLACQSLLAGECDLALAGGVAVSVPLAAGYLYEPGSVLSPDGHCRAFDARAAGSVEGNGCGIVVLRRLGDALAAGDRIYAVIRGTAVNNDGASKVGFTAPSVAGQTEVISESLMMADVPPETIGYVEAHGSGTPLGDPIEIAALTQAFRAAGAEGAGFCAVGSAKTAIGHCNTAAGAAGLIKTALALAHRTIPPSLHFETPNPEIDLAASPFYVPTAARPWEAAGAPRRAGVSSFGLGGTNVHMVLEEAPEVAPGSPPARPAELLVLSARTAPALDAAAGRLADHLEAQADLDARGLADVAWTLQTGRRAFEHRRAVVARDREGAVRALRAGGAIEGRAERGKARPVVFLFPGLGDQRAGMARELYESEPVFRAEVDRAAAKLLPILGADLREILFPAAEPVAPAAGPDLRVLLRRDAAPESPEDARLRRTRFAQPACFVVEHALGRLLMSWGIIPQALLGYSVGEYVAATLSGSLDLDDALSLVALRAKLIDALPGGAMLAVPLPGAELAGLLGPDLSLAATNGPHFAVAAGPAEAVGELARRLASRGVATVRLRTTHAFHSAAMEPAVEPLARAARGIAMRPPRIPWISNVSGTWIAAADLADPSYWARHMRGTVRFAEGLAELLSEPDRVFVEVGPGATLGTLVQQHPRAAAPLTVATLGRAEEGGSDLDAFLAAVGRLWAAGVEIDWASFQGLDGGRHRRKTALPTYPFERQRYWIEPSPGARHTAPPMALSTATKAADLADWFWVPSWTSLPLAGPVEKGSAERWLVVLDPSGVGARLATLLRARGQSVATVVLGDGFADLGDGSFSVGPRRADYEALFHRLVDEGGAPERIVHLGGLSAGEPAFEEAHASGLASLLLLAQAVSGGGGAAGTGPIRLALVGNGLAQVLDGDPVYPAKAAALGAIKVVHQELPRLSIAAVDAALPADEPGRDRLAGQIGAEAEAIGEGTAVVALRGRRRFVRGFAPLHLDSSDVPRLSPDGVYLVAGAAHGPGMAIAGHLLRHGAHVGLLLPGDFPSYEGWDGWTAPAGTPPEQDATGTAIRQLLDLEREVGLDRALLVRADDPAAAGRAVAETTARFGPLAGAFWAGAAFAAGLLQLKTPESLASTLQPAVRGAEALLDALDAAAASNANGAPRSFAVLCSTTTALSGGVGQMELAAAGAHLEALAARRAASGAPVTAVHWDPYQWGSWLAAGVAGGMSNLSAEELQAGLRAHGVPPERSAAALDRLLGHLADAPAVAVTARDLPSLLAEVDAVTADTLLAQMAAGHGEKASRPALATPFAPPKDEMEERIAGIWQDLFGIEPIGRDDSFLELGGHSLLAIQVVTQIRQALGADLPVTAVFESPTVAELGKAVRQARGESDADELDALLALVEGLSAEEAAERLAEI